MWLLVVRSGGMGLCGSIARVGTMLAPQILRLSSLASWLPGGFICITTTIAGIIWENYLYQDSISYHTVI